MRLKMKRDLDKRLKSQVGGKPRGKGTPRAHKKFQQRAAQVRRRPWRVVGVLALILALVGGVIFLFGYSRAFVVKDITVAGAKGEVARSAQERAGIPLGVPLARVNVDDVESRVLEDLRVDTVDVGRSWPSTLTLELTLREPALAVQQSGTKGFGVVDAQGVVYDTLEKAPKGVPTITAPKGELSAEALQGAMAIEASLPAPVAKQVEGVSIGEDGQLQFMVGAVAVTWGDGADAQLKGRVLEGLLEQEGLAPEAEVDPVTGPVTIDLTSATTPVVTGLPTATPTG